MSEQLKGNCHNCPLAIRYKREIAVIENYLRSALAREQIADTENLARIVFEASNYVLHVNNSAIQTNDEVIIQLAEIATKPVLDVLSSYVAGETVKPIDFSNAAVLGIYDLDKEIDVGDNIRQVISDFLPILFSAEDEYDELKNESNTYYEHLLLAVAKLQTKIDSLQDGCSGPKKSILRFGRYTCQSTNKTTMTSNTGN